MDLLALHVALVRHVTLLEAIVLASEDAARLGQDACHGAAEVADTLAKLIDPQGACVLTPDQRNLIPNPAVFKHVPEAARLATKLRADYVRQVAELLARMAKLYPGT